MLGSQKYLAFTRMKWNFTKVNRKLNSNIYGSNTKDLDWDTIVAINYQFSSVESLSHVRLFATPWTAAHQASLSITNSKSLLKLMFIESVMPPNHLICCCPLLLPSIFPSIGVFSNVSSSNQVAKVLEFQLQHQSFQWICRTDFL